MSEKPTYGFFSARAFSVGCPSSIYRTRDGLNVEVTCISSDPEAKDYDWDDKVCVGEVFEFVRQAKPEGARYVIICDDDGLRDEAEKAAERIRLEHGGHVDIVSSSDKPPRGTALTAVFSESIDEEMLGRLNKLVQKPPMNRAMRRMQKG